jgi:hypothetical protein
MKLTSLSFFIALSAAAQSREFPLTPLASLTPGSLCDIPMEFRYPERIAYCERDVDLLMKDNVFAAYRRAGFKLPESQRSSYKVDHYIPLCAGGSNHQDNLWPQHLSVGKTTDSIEKLGCDKLAAGRITQAKFVEIIKKVKNNPATASAVSNELGRM